MSNITVCVPSGDMVDAEFAMCYAAAMTYHGAVHDDDLNQIWRQGTIITEQRNELCKKALENGADWIIFLDSDMTFPYDIFERMIAHDEDVIAANCCKRRRPVSMTARKEDPDDPSQLVPIWPDREVKGLEECAVVGTAVMCIRSSALLKVEWPYFQQPWMHDQQRNVGEDLYFCGMLKRAGIPIYIDHDLSWEIGHVGKYVWEAKDALAEHEIANAGLWDHIRELEAV